MITTDKVNSGDQRNLLAIWETFPWLLFIFLLLIVVHIGCEDKWWRSGGWTEKLEQEYTRVISHNIGHQQCLLLSQTGEFGLRLRCLIFLNDTQRQWIGLTTNSTKEIKRCKRDKFYRTLGINWRESIFFSGYLPQIILRLHHKEDDRTKRHDAPFFSCNLNCQTQPVGLSQY